MSERGGKSLRPGFRLAGATTTPGEWAHYRRSMPIVTFHLVEGQHSSEQLRALLTRASALYSDVLDSPIDRVRAFVTRYPADHVAVAGELVSDHPRSAPYFEFLVLAGRPVEQRHRLLAGFTDLMVELLGSPRELIRGKVIQLDPADWGIGGEPASVTRRTEIEARATAGAGS